MSDKQLPARPNLEQYKKQSKELLQAHRVAEPDAIHRIQRHHPTLHKLSLSEIPAASFTLTDAQLVLAREHNFESWTKFAAYLERKKDRPKAYADLLWAVVNTTEFIFNH